MKKTFSIITLLFLIFPFNCFSGGPIGGGPIGYGGVDMDAPGTIGKFQLDHNTETLNADRTILITDKPIQFLDANGVDRNITLPAEASSTDLVFTIYNDSDGAAENLIVRNDTPITITTLGPKQGATFSCDGTNWNTPNAKGIYYDGIDIRVGLGLVKPVVKMHIHDTIPRIQLTNATTGVTLLDGIQWYMSGLAAYILNKEAGILGFGTNNVIYITIDASGKFGINTGSPDTIFEIEEQSANAEETISVYHNTEATAAIITMRKADGTAAAPALVDDNAVLGRINFKGYDGSGWHTGAKIEARIDGTPSDGDDMPAELVFATTPEASGSPTEWMTLMPSGQLKMAESSDPAVLADHVFFYGKDVAGTGEAFAADAAANAAQLTPHNFTLFEPDVTEAYPWSYYAENKALGIKINVDMAGMIRAVEGLTGKTFIHTQNIAKSVDLEKVYKDAWIENYIKVGIQESEVTKEQALETMQVDVDKWYEIEVCDDNGTCKIVKQRNKIDEKITGYDLIEDEVKPRIEIIWETEKADKIQVKANMYFDGADGKFYTVTKPTKAQAITAAETEFTFNPPKWLGDRLSK